MTIGQRIANQIGQASKYRDTARRWLETGFWAITDQGLFAISNFGLNVMLARWLAPDGYGAFSVAYTIFLLLGTFHSAMLTEPMLVLGPIKFEARRNGYFRALLRGHWLFGGTVATLLGISALALWRISDSPVTPAIAGLALASPFILFQWLMRRACYANLQPRLAAQAGAIYFAAMATGILILQQLGWLGAFSGLLIMAAASFASGGWLVTQLQIDLTAPRDTGLERDALREHWTYGRWAVGAAALAWVPANAFHLLVPIWGGLEAAAALRSIMNLAMPMLQVISALGILLVPALVRARARGTSGRTMVLALSTLATGALGYLVLLGIFAEPLMRSLYGGIYDEYTSLLWVAGALPVIAVIVAVFGSALRAAGQSNNVFWSSVVSAGVALSVGVLLVHAWTVLGALLATIVAWTSGGAVMVHYVLRSRADGGDRMAR